MILIKSLHIEPSLHTKPVFAEPSKHHIAKTEKSQALRCLSLTSQCSLTEEAPGIRTQPPTYPGPSSLKTAKKGGLHFSGWLS